MGPATWRLVTSTPCSLHRALRPLSILTPYNKFLEAITVCRTVMLVGFAVWPQNRLGLDLRRLALTFGVDAGVAQLAEQLFCKQQVTGSIPVAGSRCRFFPRVLRKTLASTASIARVLLQR